MLGTKLGILNPKSKNETRNSFPEQTEMNPCDMKSWFHTDLFFQSFGHRHHKYQKFLSLCTYTIS